MWQRALAVACGLAVVEAEVVSPLYTQNSIEMVVNNAHHKPYRNPAAHKLDVSTNYGACSDLTPLPTASYCECHNVGTSKSAAESVVDCLDFYIGGKTFSVYAHVLPCGKTPEVAFNVTNSNGYWPKTFPLGSRYWDTLLQFTFGDPLIGLATGVLNVTFTGTLDDVTLIADLTACKDVTNPTTCDLIVGFPTKIIGVEGANLKQHC